MVRNPEFVCRANDIVIHWQRMLFARVAGKCLLFRRLTGATGRNIGPLAALLNELLNFP